MTDFKKIVEDSGVPVSESDLIAEFREIAISEGAPFNNTSEFSPFWRLVKALMVKPLLWLIELQYTLILPAFFLKTAEGIWVDIFAWQLNIERKGKVKARGLITFTRGDVAAELNVPEGTVIQSAVINGTLFRLLSVESAVFAIGDTSLQVVCEAEQAGEAYNLAVGFYHTVLSTSLSGLVTVSNDVGWLQAPGVDVEDDDALKLRCRNQFTAVNNRHIDAAYKASIASFPGIDIDDIYILHDAPRGAGTANGYILFDHTPPTQAFLDSINHFINDEGNHGLGDDFVVSAIPTYEINNSLDVWFKNGDLMTPVQRDAALAQIDVFIRVAFREVSHSGYTPTRTYPNRKFVWSTLIKELHVQFPEIESLNFASDADLFHVAAIPHISLLFVLLGS